MVKDTKIFSIGVCDWTLNMVHDENVFEKAKALGFDGVQIAFDINNTNRSLVNETIQERYKIKAAQYDMKICSCAAINFLQTPLAVSNDPIGIFSCYIKAMINLGIEIILLPFFGRGDINIKTTPIAAIMRHIRKTPTKDILRGKTIEILKSIAKLAEEAQITIGIETLINADALKRTLEQIGSNSIKVYYDAGNAKLMGYNILNEIKLLGMNDICQIHFKEKYTTIGHGRIDYKRIFELLVAEGYNNWLILEKSINPFLGLDTSMKRNISFLKGLMQQS